MTNDRWKTTAWRARPLDWYRLMHEAETIRARWGLGLASVWEHINDQDYDTARAELDCVVDDIRRGYWGLGKS